MLAVRSQAAVAGITMGGGGGGVSIGLSPCSRLSEKRTQLLTCCSVCCCVRISVTSTVCRVKAQVSIKKATSISRQ